MTRTEAFAQFEGIDIEEAETHQDTYDEKVFSIGSREYLVVSEDEARELAVQDIKQSLWAFNTDFIIDHTTLPYEAGEMVRSFQEDKCEGANETLLALVGDFFGELVDDAISADGLAHFLATYDGEEEQVEDWLIYRRN